MTTIENFRTALNSKLDELAMTYGETTALDEAGIGEVSSGIDEVNETLNPNLPKRPGS